MSKCPGILSYVWQVSCGGAQLSFPLNKEILKWTDKTREILSRAKLPDAVEFYNIYGIDVDTGHSVWLALYTP